MSWDREIEELRRRSALAQKMGGDDKVARQHEFGKMTIRERIDCIADEGSFHEIGEIAGRAEYDENGELRGFMPSNFVFGTCEIDGRPVVVSGDDFTVRGGSADASIGAKRSQAEGLARDLKIPHIRLVDGVVDNLSVVPSVSLALGSVAGIGAARVASSHYSVIVSETAQMMIAGPALVDWASLGDVSKEELGHARIHTRNGAIDDRVDTEEEAFDRACRFLSYLPSNVDELLPVIEPTDDPNRREEELLSIVPRNPRRTYKMRNLIQAVVDKNSFFEIGRDWGRSQICCFARLDGIPVALFAEDPAAYGGSWTADSCRKLCRFIDLASTFHLPLIHLEDCPGFFIGKESEESGTIRFGSQALATLRQADVPFCCVVIRKAFGVAGGANQKPGSHHFRYSWPSGDWGSLPIEGGIEVAYKAELAEAADYDSHLAKIKERLNRVRSPFRSAEYFEIEEIIDPRDTRPILCRWAHLARKATRPGKQAFTFRP